MGVAGACAFGVARGGVRVGVASGNGPVGGVARHAGSSGGKTAHAASMDAHARGVAPRLSEGLAHWHFRAVVFCAVGISLAPEFQRLALLRWIRLIETALTPKSRRCSVAGYQQCYVRLWLSPFPGIRLFPFLRLGVS